MSRDRPDFMARGSKVCMALNCQNVASEQVSLPLRNGGEIRIKVCSKCEHKFVDEEERPNDIVRSPLFRGHTLPEQP